ncbi:MAG: bifunctional adenosylcobinamide kinase/adenosylcobinamide-phosphate guanylyltransferase [Alphaproteobacteria bacterium]|nr:bifunctional adenosylcobinamide kinase/adenosylcobinamide-phosphate guanylyltransferase [Alphaproteobacteria bacterium]
MGSIFILGGARSGKSARAQTLAVESGAPCLYIATAEARDAEMRERIARHRADRPAGWITIEEPLALTAILTRPEAAGHCVVVDCLTLWLSNLFEHRRDIGRETEQFVAAFSDRVPPTILVSNEIGLGLVPETALGRDFRDAQGRLNQRIAAAADRVEFVAAGLPLVLKGG